MRCFRKIAVFLGVAAVAGGCVTNDIPYPKIVAQITEFEVSGQTEPAVIDNKTNTVTVSLADSVDRSHVMLLKFIVSDDAEVSPEPVKFIDLRNDLQYTLTTYQDYTWTITATQTTERYITADNQVGEARFNEDEKEALIYVSKTQPLNNINITAMKLGPEGEEITPGFTTVRDFTQPVKFTSTFRGRSEEWKVSVRTSSEDVMTGTFNTWAKRASLKGSYVAGGPQPGFEYRKNGDQQWASTDNVEISETSFTGWIYGLVPGTEYEYRAFSGASKGEIMTFTTEKAQQFPNMGFDNWSVSDDVVFPNLDASAENYYWDSGNKGAKTVNKNPTKEETVFVVKGSAARLQSEDALVLAAGNIFTGQYLKTFKVPPGAEINFGRPYTSRPARMKGYYNYTPGRINKFTNIPEFKDKTDSCHVYVILSDLDEPLHINTQKKIFADAYKDNWVAYGEFKTGRQSPQNEYEPFTVELKYFSDTRKPKYAVIVATSSKYGDYFVGSTNSLLYIDEFEFEFD